jgi:NAD(P)-dependent dehydrogenase (short-subunit alcohol dehydrogenase family)
MELMTTTLITGANKDLGYETARRLIAKGHTVLLVRDPHLGSTAATALASSDRRHRRQVRRRGSGGRRSA